MSIVQDVGERWKGLSRSEKRSLATDSQTASDAGLRMRCKIIFNLRRGQRPSRIAEFLGCGRSQVYRVAHRFLDEGLIGLIDRREDNGGAKVTEDFEIAVLVAVAKSPQDFGYDRPTWTQELLVLVANEQVHIRVSTSTISRLLARHRAKNKRPKPIVTCPWSKARKTRRLNQIRRLRDNLPKGEVLLYVDEVDIHLNPKIGNDWMLPGEQKTVLTPGKNEKRYLCGALNHRTGRLAWVEGKSKNGALFISMVDHLVKRAYSSAKKIHIVLDNYRIHTSRAVQAAQSRWGGRVVFHFLPPYCPDENRIERLWKDLHDNVTRNHRCRTMDELMDHVRTYLEPRRRTGSHHYASKAA